MIVGFLMPSKELPTITVAYISNSYASAELNFAHVNSKSAEKYEIVPAQDDDLPISRGFIMEAFDATSRRSAARLPI